MALMKNGGSAVDAIEIAVKVLEDREITNAGYGSNLAMDGVVECDAVVVDHYGRSGGAGAVARRWKRAVWKHMHELTHEQRSRILSRWPGCFLTIPRRLCRFVESRPICSSARAQPTSLMNTTWKS
jgi:hypothetical protein